MGLTQGTRLSADTYRSNINNGNSQGIYQNNDKFQFGFVGDVDYYDKDVNNYNFAKIEEKLFDFIYPVGSIYINTDSAKNPNSLFPNTFWELYAQGKCLFGVNTGSHTDTKASILEGDTNGGHTYPFYHTHSVPAHNHPFGKDANTYVTTTDNGKNHTHSPGGSAAAFITGGGANWAPTGFKKVPDADKKGKKFMVTDETNTTKDNIGEPSKTAVASAEHHHFFKGNTGSSSKFNTSYSPDRNYNTVADGANLPPYVGVYMWKRVR